MTAEEARDRLLTAFRAEVHKHHGHIGDLEERLGRYRGYFAKVSSGRWPIALDQFLKALEILGVDPAEFFARALDARPNVDELLAAAAGDALESPELAELVKAGREIERRLDLAAEDPPDGG